MGWEMGGGLGHVVPLLAVARGLREHGHRPVLALRDVVEPAFLLRPDGFAVVQAPAWQPPRARRGPATATLADIFVVMGFGHRDRIHAIVAAWDGLIGLVRPKLVVAEFSPGLCLAARGRVPVVAIGSVGLSGKGFTQGPQKRLDFLPEQHTDFIFSVVGEHFGLIGCSLLLVAFLMLFWRGIRTAMRAPDRFGFYLALGITCMLVLQGLINMCVCLGLMPTKGLPLPFISYGGSSLLASADGVRVRGGSERSVRSAGWRFPSCVARRPIRRGSVPIRDARVLRLSVRG